MRQLFQEQLPLTGPSVNHRHAQELNGMDQILRDNPDITALVMQDLEGRVQVPGWGREGMTAEQVLRAALLKQLNTWTYEELSFHLADSWTYRSFCGIGVLYKAPSRATLQRNIKGITEETWEAINRVVLGYAAERDVEDGRKVRTDGTVTETPIHAPTDSSLLWDSVRVLTRLLARARDDFGLRAFPSRARRAKRRALDVLNAATKRKRTKAYRDLLEVTRETMGYAETAVAQLNACGDVLATLAAGEMERYAGLARRVVDQTERRVLQGETVPASEKIVSIFEPHTDIIVKDRRDTHYGHKLTLSAGTSGLVLDWVIEDGNPADSTLVVRTIERHKEIYGRVPRQMAFDGCYASRENLKEAKELGVQDVAFSKKRGLEVLDMARSRWVYKRLRNFRAGMESWISFLKRGFGLERCSWRGADGFARYVGASIVAANLLTLARHLA
jgi:transposase, IS5 family